MQKHKVTRKVETPAEYKDAVGAAETLGLEVSSEEFYGTWQTNDGCPCWPKRTQVEKAGRKYFTVQMDGRREKIESDGGHLTIGFK